MDYSDAVLLMDYSSAVLNSVMVSEILPLIYSPSDKIQLKSSSWYEECCIGKLFYTLTRSHFLGTYDLELVRFFSFRSVRKLYTCTIPVSTTATILLLQYCCTTAVLLSPNTCTAVILYYEHGPTVYRKHAPPL